MFRNILFLVRAKLESDVGLTQVFAGMVGHRLHCSPTYNVARNRAQRPIHRHCGYCIDDCAVRSWTCCLDQFGSRHGAPIRLSNSGFVFTFGDIASRLYCDAMDSFRGESEDTWDRYG
jgi:hypothetical protein